MASTPAEGSLSEVLSELSLQSKLLTHDPIVDTEEGGSAICFGPACKALYAIYTGFYGKFHLSTPIEFLDYKPLVRGYSLGRFFATHWLPAHPERHCDWQLGVFLTKQRTETIDEYLKLRKENGFTMKMALLTGLSGIHVFARIREMKKRVDLTKSGSFFRPPILKKKNHDRK